jgi:peptidoglycan/LPS O-acetylase OafA/YrhL
MNDRLRKLQFLDSLRGLAILLVLVVHSGGLIELFGLKLSLANFGQRGVQLFYEISAFSLLYSCYARQERSWGVFFIRRFFRIAPLFYLSIVANYISGVLIAKNPPLSFASYASGFLFLFGFHPDTINAVAPAGWSIAVEATFYAIFPFLFCWIKDLGAALTFTAISLTACFFVCFGANVYPFNALPDDYVHFLWFPVEVPVFCFGFVAFFCWRDLILVDPVALTVRSILKNQWGGRAVSLALLSFGALVVYESFPTSNYRLYLNSISFIFLILGLAIHPWRLLVNPVTGWIGKLSFSLYLIHPYLHGLIGSIVDYLEKIGPFTLYGSYLGLSVTFALFLIGSFIVSLITYPFIEQPGINAGKRLIEWWAGHRTPAKDANSQPMTPTMENQPEVVRLRSKLRLCYAGWVASLICMLVFLALYRRDDPAKTDQPIAQYREQVARYQSEVDTLSAAVLRNQRELKNAQGQLLQLMKDYQNAIETIKKLQARPAG